MYINDRYQVLRYPEEGPQEAGWPAMIWLSIKRIDRRPIHDWRELQEIKNCIIGPENEAVELYPAESRLVDTANQYHLWVLAEPGIHFPFGYWERAVCGPEVADKLGARQRPFTTQRSRKRHKR